LAAKDVPVAASSDAIVVMLRFLLPGPSGRGFT
jgi:hypothetical protein